MVEPVTSLFWNVLETHELIELLFQYEAVIDCEAVTGMVEPVTSLFWNVLETHELIELLFQYEAVIDCEAVPYKDAVTLFAVIPYSLKVALALVKAS